MAGRRRSFERSVLRRRTSWEGTIFDEATITVASSVVFSLVPEAVLEIDAKPTIARIRGHLLVRADADSTAGAFGMLAMGIMMVTSTVSAAGAVPKPIAEIGSSWMWYHTALIGEQVASAESNGLSFERVVVDTKAMRKVGINETLVLVLTMQTCEGTLVANLCGIVRTLLLHH